MSEINYQALRERYSPQPVPKCRICGDEMTVQRICGSHITYGCTGATYDDKGCYYAEGCSIADGHYGLSRVTVIDVSDSEVLALQDEWEAQSKRIAELKTNLATLTAENVALRSKAAELAHEASKVYSAYNATITEPDGDFMDMQTLHEMQCIETPATDAFLNEVRAVAFNELCAAFVRHAKIAGLDDGDSVTIKEATDVLLYCAEQLRAPE